MNFKRIVTAAACVCAVLGGGLTAQAGSWVGLSSSGVEQTYVDGVPAVFPFEEDQKMYYPVLYKDAAYIPLRTAAMASYPVAAFLLNNRAAALFTFVPSFLVSTAVGAAVSVTVLEALGRTGALGRLEGSLR